MKYISSLTNEELETLEKAYKNDPSARVRMRAHAVLLSARGFSINEMVRIFNVQRDTVSCWLNAWETSGLAGLTDRPGQGRNTVLTQAEEKIAMKLIEKYPRSLRTVIDKLVEKTGKEVSIWTLKRLAKTEKHRWKRIRKRLNKKPNQQEFEKAKKEIKELRVEEQEGKVDLFFFDESGFTLEPAVPYAWQPVGKVLEIPTANGPRLNVLGFLSSTNQLHSYTIEGTVDTDVVVAVFDAFSEKINKKTIVLLDNAPTHTSKKFKANIKRWKAKGLIIKPLPAYSPQLNLIEILWRFIKYYWLPFSAYGSFKKLVNAVTKVLKAVGSEYRINFA